MNGCMCFVCLSINHGRRSDHLSVLNTSPGHKGIVFGQFRNMLSVNIGFALIFLRHGLIWQHAMYLCQCCCLVLCRSKDVILRQTCSLSDSYPVHRVPGFMIEILQRHLSALKLMCHG